MTQRAHGDGRLHCAHNVRHSDLPDFNPINHHRNVLTGGEIDA